MRRETWVAAVNREQTDSGGPAPGPPVCGSVSCSGRGGGGGVGAGEGWSLQMRCGGVSPARRGVCVSPGRSDSAGRLVPELGACWCCWSQTVL